MSEIEPVLKQIFQNSIKFSEKVINVDTSKEIQGDIEPDEVFVKDLEQMNEHHATVEKEVFAKRVHLTQQEYQFVQQTGQIHYKANIFNETSCKKTQDINPQDKCPCGCGRARGDPLPFCIQTESQPFFGQGIILFFFYTKKMMLLAFLSVLIYGIYSFTTNYVSDDTEENCDKPGALAFLCEMKVKGGVSNKQDQHTLLLIQMWLGFLFCLVWSIGVRLSRNLGRRKSDDIDDALDSSSDYMLFLQKLPIGNYHERDILNYVQRLWDKIENNKDGELRIKSVQIIYNMSEVRERISELHNLAKALLQCFVKTKAENGKKSVRCRPYRIIPAKIQEYKQKKELLLAKYKELNDFREQFLTDEQLRSKYSSECALVEFASHKQLVTFLNTYGIFRRTFVKDLIEKFRYCCKPKEGSTMFKGRQLKIFKAPEPSDIFWLHCEKKNRMRRTLFVWFLNLLLNGASYGFLELFRKLKDDHPQVPALSFLSIIAINLFNRLIWNILLNIVFIEENYTKTANIMSVMNKSYVSQSINIILIPIILSYFSENDLDGPTGLAGQVHDFQLTSFLFMTLFNLVNVPFRFTQFLKCFKCLRRPIIRYFCRISGEFDTYNQMKDALTFLYDPPLVPVAGFYVYITGVISQAMFFCHLQPSLLFYLVINIFLFHNMNRYIVFRMSKITDLLDISVFETIAGFALNIPLFYGVSSIVFLKIRGDAVDFSYYVPSILCIVIWFFSVQSPFNLYSKFVNWLIKYFELHPEPEPTQEKGAKYDQTTIYFIGQIINHSLKNWEDHDEENSLSSSRLSGYKEVTTRKENYFGAIGTNDLFNFQSKIQEVKGKYHGKNKQFCERFAIGRTANIIRNHNQIKREEALQEYGEIKLGL